MAYVQKVVLPAREHAWLAAGLDTVCGYVLRMEDAVWADTPEKLYRAHGLAFPGSPVPPGTPFIDVVRMPVTFATSVVAATGGNDAASAARMGGPFVDRPPFTGNGFVRDVEGFLPLWWLDPARVSAGTEIWRVHADTRQEMIAVYPHVGVGWAFPVGMTPEAPVGSVAPSDLLGVFVRWEGGRTIGDILPDGRVVICSAEERAGWTRGPRGPWFTVMDSAQSAAMVAAGAVYAPRFTARWRGLPFQLTARSMTQQGMFDAVYLGRDADVAEAAGLVKTDAGVYEAVLPGDQLTDTQGAEISPQPPSSAG